MTPKFTEMQFVVEQGLISSINAAVRRVHIYENRNKVSKKKYHLKKDEMRKDFAKAIIKAASKLISTQSDQENALIKAVETVVEKLKNHKNIFTAGQPSFGIAQKALNLFLKYLWCLNISKHPLHCPIDSQILAKINWKKKGESGSTKTWPWFNKDDYKLAIELIRKEYKNTKSQSYCKMGIVKFQTQPWC